MRPLSDAWRARLSRETQTLCLCWRLTRRDGAVFGLTNHDRSLLYDDVVYAPGAPLDGSTFEHGANLQMGQASAEGVLSNAFIKDSDLKDGVWDGCRVDIHRADWQARDLGLWHIWSGYLSRVQTVDTGQFTAELLSLSVDLQRPIGRVVQRLCDAQLGDRRCSITANERVCDQRYETCRDVFSNVENFRGFPHLPGNDVILAGPAATQNDGGKR